MVVNDANFDENGRPTWFEFIVRGGFYQVSTGEEIFEAAGDMTVARFDWPFDQEIRFGVYNRRATMVGRYDEE